MTAQNPCSLEPVAHTTPSAPRLRTAYQTAQKGLAVLGLTLTLSGLSIAAYPDWRAQAEQQLFDWLQQRQGAEPETLAGPPPAVPLVSSKSSTKEQSHLTDWLSRRYRVAAEPLVPVVAEAFAIGKHLKLDPTLILAVMAIESRFNPFAQSPVGAQGLMQVLTRVHAEKYDSFGGKHTAFDPVVNLRVGVQVLKDCIQNAGGSIEGGLKRYVGAIDNDATDYIAKVMGEQKLLRSVARGSKLAPNTPNPLVTRVASTPKPALKPNLAEAHAENLPKPERS